MGSDTPQQDAHYQSDEVQPASAELLVVGIGASSGGLAALQQFFVHMPRNNAMSFVVILHLSPDYESHAASVIQQATHIPVTQVTEAVAIEPNHVYVIPPNNYLTIANGRLELREQETPRGHRAPIDLFFRALAEAQGRNAAAIVLSGSGADGTIGLQRVKEHGGVVLVQEPHEAEFDAMPRNAIATGLVDYVLPVAEMATALMNYWNNASTLLLDVSDAPSPEEAGDALREIFVLLRTRTGHDFSQYKRATVLRRIARRMQVSTVTDLDAYLSILRARPDEVQSLLHDMLISVTNFFRDAPAWQAVEAVVPQLFAGKEPSDQVRVWVAGCATGEEAYTVAMLLSEYAATLAHPPTIQIFATDIDEDGIAAARQGRYLNTIGADVSFERLARFFTPEQDRYRVNKELRDMVLFAQHNLLRDPPFSKLDLITCRNLLIYLNRDMQEQVLRLFHFVLRSQGYLLLGTSESTDVVPNLYMPIDKAQRLFRHLFAPATLPLMPSLPLVGTTRQSPAMQVRGKGNHTFGDLHRQLLGPYTPPSVIVNEGYEIVHLSGDVGRFLALTEGEPSHNLLNLVRPSLRLELRTALFAAVQGSGVERRRLRVELDRVPQLVELIVQPLREPEWARGTVMVLFNVVEDAGHFAPSVVTSADSVVRQLEEELQRTKEQLRSTLEQYEAAAEEYKATNEELQAINEELRAASEELETGKEELQSVNEELTTVNQELKHKVEEISQSNNDLQNLMAATEIGTIFVDREIRITRYTPSAQTIFNLIPSDIHRPLAHITHTLRDQQFPDDARQVLQTLTKVEREVEGSDGRWYLARLLPYRTLEDKIDGVVLTLTDSTERKRAEQAMRESEARLRLLIESARDFAIIALDPQRRITAWNSGAATIFGYAEAEIIGQVADVLFTPEDRAADAPEAEVRAARDTGSAVDERWHLRKDGSRLYASGVLTLLRADNQLLGFVKIARDLTEQRRAEQALQQAHDELEARVAARTAELVQLHATQRELLRSVVTAQEDERRRVARELHDQLGQQISALRMSLAALAKAPADIQADSFANLQKIAASLDEDVDRLALELRPTVLDDMGLHAALQQHVEEWSTRHGISAEFQASGINHVRLPAELETTIYRVVQEALTNVLKHAAARTVSILLEQKAHEVRTIVEDDGRGFEEVTPDATTATTRRLGLIGIQERVALVNGTVTVESTLGRGTTVYIRVPLPADEKGE